MDRREWLKRVTGGAAAAASATLLSSCVGRRSDAGFATPEPARSGERYSPEEVADIVAKLPGRIDCTGCGRCMPCGYGVDIPGMFAAWNEAIDEGILPSTADDLDDPKKLAPMLNWLHDTEKSVGDLHMAVRCIACGHCTSEGQCAQRIPIAGHMVRIDKFIGLLREKEALVN